MTFLILWKESLRYIFRSRLPLLLLIFSFFLHYVGISAFKESSWYSDGIISVMGPREGMFVSIYLTLFMGVFLAAIYGIWMVPYFHQGERSLMTFVLPVSKWWYPLVYSLSFLLLILLEYFILFGTFTWVFGKSALLQPRFSWGAVTACLCLEFLVVHFLLYFFSAFSLLLGHMTTLFLAAGSFIALQVAGALFRLGLDQYAEEMGGKLLKAYRVYRWMPPLGELIFSLKNTFSQGIVPYTQFVSWTLWTVIVILFFRWLIRHPR